jgi:inner membrane protein
VSKVFSPQEGEAAPHRSTNQQTVSRASRAADRFSRLAVPELIAAAVVLVVSDQALLRVGSHQLLIGLLDETAHLMTGVLVLAALRRPRDRAFALGLLAGSVLIDLDHIPKTLGIDWISQGTPRPYSHSLLTLAVLALLTCAWRSRRWLLFGALVGVTVHFGRDLADQASGMPLFWPFTDESYNIPHLIYLALMGIIAAIATIRAHPARYAAHNRTSTEGPSTVAP